MIKSQIDSDIFAFKRISDQNRRSVKSGKNEENDEQAFKNKLLQRTYGNSGVRE